MKQILISLLLTFLWSPAQALENRLQGHPSPYLAMHGQDPVAWQEWGPEAFELARREGRLLFVSVGYFACHWCHVMQQESYQDPEIAALLNGYFVPIKIDRELLPDIDQRLMDFAERTRGRGGWPLNVFLTPEGYPVLAVLYTPPERLQRQIRFLNEQWQSDPERINAIARQAQGALAEQIAEEQSSADGKVMSGDALRGDELRGAYVRRALSVADTLSGGFGDQAKFPSVPQLEALLSLYVQMPLGADYRQEIGRFLDITLERMSRLGLHDEIAGGFFRYTVDPGWHTPHYEKMLYDNAQLAALYARAAQYLDQEKWLQVAGSTLDFMLRDLGLSRDGALQGFATSLSAQDSEGLEGGGYLWSAEELDQILSPEQRTLAGELWAMQGEAQHEGHYLPLRVTDLDNYPAQAVAAVRQALLKARQKRAIPRDEKILVAWNAQVLRALSLYLKQKESATYRVAAKALFQSLTREVSDAGVEHLHSALDASAGRAALIDYALLARAVLDWAEVDPDKPDEEVIALSEALVRSAWAQFHADAGWRLSHDVLLQYGVARQAPPDGALPSAAAVLLETAQRLQDRGYLADLDDDVQQALQQARGWTAKHPFWAASFVPLM